MTMVLLNNSLLCHKWAARIATPRGILIKIKGRSGSWEENHLTGLSPAAFAGETDVRSEEPMMRRRGVGRDSAPPGLAFARPEFDVRAAGMEIDLVQFFVAEGKIL